MDARAPRHSMDDTTSTFSRAPEASGRNLDEPWRNAGIGTAFIAVDPAAASAWLKKNRDNRPIRPSTIDMLTQKILSGQWVVTHQGVAFSKRGRLIDGQHRLMAIAAAGRPTTISVTWGLAEDAFDHVDTGNIRTAADMFSRRRPDAKYRALMAATAAHMMRGLGSDEFSKDYIVDAADEFYEQTIPILEALNENRFTRKSAVAAAFGAAIRKGDSFPGPQGRRSASTITALATDLAKCGIASVNMGLLFRRLSAKEDARGARALVQRSHTYAACVSAIRATLDGRVLSRIEATSIDWGQEKPGKKQR